MINLNNFKSREIAKQCGWKFDWKENAWHIRKEDAYAEGDNE